MTNFGNLHASPGSCNSFPTLSDANVTPNVAAWTLNRGERLGHGTMVYVSCFTMILFDSIGRQLTTNHKVKLNGCTLKLEWRNIQVGCKRLQNKQPLTFHDDVIKWKQFPRYWPFVRGIHRSLVNIPRKGQWCGVLMFSSNKRLNKQQWRGW